ncbi:UpxY family transcription antiterminator [Flavobacterium sp. KBS0721]|jgi:transcription antitermination factor NusG|uniref:UpxY family transcription antiterminator n=1 Tax=Flavobacterium sp. KBS0721 TaxID=1179672 RepID=UPI00098F462E|nr:UpxY family transcription antiterminator [Flavobacterium sp. KBS0721]QDW22626.1 UpxY family transcription antiterminator [Flavobacterium sp. KBS0721]
MNWYVIYTKPKWEKRVADQLTQLGVNCYCPLIKTTKQYSDRKKTLEVPLFSNYVFVQLADKDRNLVFLSRGAIRYLYWLGKHAIVKDKEISTIKEWLTENAAISISQYNVGETIKVNSGPFLNHDAVIKEVTNSHYVLILESLGCVLKIKHKAAEIKIAI